MEAETEIESSSLSSTANSIKAFIAGGFGGVCAVLVGYPFDLTKTRLQTAAPGTYKGALDVVKKILARDGLKGMYRGMVPPLLGVTPSFAISFWAYDLGKKLVYTFTPERVTPALTTTEVTAAGFFSAIPATLIIAPFERAKVVLQVQGQGAVAVALAASGSGKQYSGILDVSRGLYKEGGVRSIFRGTTATLARDAPGSAAYFAVYEVTKQALTPKGKGPGDLDLGSVLVAGGLAGVAMWNIGLPADVLKSRIQSAPPGVYTGFVDCARKTVASDGIGALWKGFVPTMIRAFPANAAVFVGVEFSRKVLDKLF
ncbi:hypothetical protein M408DRAFT_328434 [Serendipita vermifera MAFF 305830]|uniref:Mitochondrial carrier n=1 Tax=Serendipita vermifera MAFF 305830 TaxID=933852 RepID=A0A0C2XLY3_SERVB|nr:hypothetical protein M408DRAFT_328434 [Serendipita vermifera MAFF 305830]